MYTSLADNWQKKEQLVNYILQCLKFCSDRMGVPNHSFKWHYLKPSNLCITCPSWDQTFTTLSNAPVNTLKKYFVQKLLMVFCVLHILIQLSCLSKTQYSLSLGRLLEWFSADNIYHVLLSESRARHMQIIPASWALLTLKI